MAQLEGVREPAVAGSFYPSDPASLDATVGLLMDEARKEKSPFLGDLRRRGVFPRCIIAPHAGYVYSGPVAASAYSYLELASGSVEKVAVFGPSHRMPIEGLALTSAATFAMPGFGLAADGEGVDALYSEAGARFVDAAHSEEHSIEVHLPFIRKVLGEVALTAVAVGESPPEEVGRAITTLLEDPRRTVVVSSDLSHYLDYDSASALDASTAEAILSLRFEDIGYDQACGRNCIRGLLWAARRLELEPELLDLRNSGDTAGTRDSVVGYPAFAFWNGTA